MQPGLMQNAPLLISGILTHAARAHGDREIVSRLVDEPLWRYDYAGLANRAAQAAAMLRALGIGSGDCVSSLAWNTHRHYELFFAVPGIGACCTPPIRGCRMSRSCTPSTMPAARCCCSTAASPPASPGCGRG